MNIKPETCLPIWISFKPNPCLPIWNSSEPNPCLPIWISFKPNPCLSIWISFKPNPFGGGDLTPVYGCSRRNLDPQPTAGSKGYIFCTKIWIRNIVLDVLRSFRSELMNCLRNDTEIQRHLPYTLIPPPETRLIKFYNLNTSIMFKAPNIHHWIV